MKNFSDYVNENYSNYKEDIKEALMRGYCGYAEKDQHHLFSDYIREHHNNAFSGSASWERNVTARVILPGLSGNALAVLEQLIKGPLFDGDVNSKNGRAELEKCGLITRVVNNGQFGDNAANELGWLVWKLYTKNKSGAEPVNVVNA
ncbi:MAG: hypothetical protein ACRDBQ_18940 [Shewanella sp.]